MLAMWICLGKLTGGELTFLTSGHSHEDIDALFSLLRGWIEAHKEIWSPQAFQQCIQSFYDDSRHRPYEPSRAVVSLTRFRDWRSRLSLANIFLVIYIFWVFYRSTSWTYHNQNLHEFLHSILSGKIGFPIRSTTPSWWESVVRGHRMCCGLTGLVIQDSFMFWAILTYIHIDCKNQKSWALKHVIGAPLVCCRSFASFSGLHFLGQNWVHSQQIWCDPEDNFTFFCHHIQLQVFSKPQLQSSLGVEDKAMDEQHRMATEDLSVLASLSCKGDPRRLPTRTGTIWLEDVRFMMLNIMRETEPFKNHWFGIISFHLESSILWQSSWSRPWTRKLMRTRLSENMPIWCVKTLHHLATVFSDLVHSLNWSS